MKVTALILAAGQSTRMGTVNKLTKIWRGKALLRHCVDAFVESKVDDVIVVTGHEHDDVSCVLQDDLAVVHNPNFASGMGSSIAAGMAQVEKCDGVIIALGDMPLVTASHINALLAAFDNDAGSIVVATCKGKLGNPVLFGAGHFQDLSMLTGDRGARAIIDASKQVTEVEIGDAARRDLDTPDRFAE